MGNRNNFDNFNSNSQANSDMQQADVDQNIGGGNVNSANLNNNTNATVQLGHLTESLDQMNSIEKSLNDQVHFYITNFTKFCEKKILYN